MEALCQELGVPRKQIRETIKSDRLTVIVHQSWLKCLIEQKRVAKFPIHPGFDEWPTGEDGLGNGWKLTYFTIYKRFSHKVIPLANCRKENSDTETVLSFAQLMSLISQTNHRNLWKNAFSKYSGQQSKVPTKESINKSERNAINLVPYDSVLLEAIQRTYGCPVISAKTDKAKQQASDEVRNDKKRASDGSGSHRFDAHNNLYPVTAVIETNSYFFVIYGTFLDNNLFDCVSYSPAILDRSHNKPLFVIYQLFQLAKTFHDRGLILGNIGLNDIFVTDNLWLNVMPQIDANILQTVEHLADAPADEFATRKNSHTIGKYGPIHKHLSHSLKDYCEMWCNGQLSNFDYLTILNNLSGRRLGYPGYHHIMPWVTDFISRNGMNWRDLTKSKYRLNKGDQQLDLMFTPTSATNMMPHHVSDVLSEITYYVYMARRTPKEILCKHVRPIWVPAEYPATIARLQEWTPDECIPEFFTDPLVFKSIHEDLPDLEVPTWSSCPEDFITKHREALESQYVSERLHHWIDLNFGYKLTGNAAVKAKNVYLSLVDDHQTLCKHGIVQLFIEPHPPKQYQTVWTSKTPPRIYSQSEARRRLTRSTEDLSLKYLHEPESSDTNISPSTATATRSSSRNRTNSPNVSDEISAAMMERSTSLHSNVQRNQIILPKDYNPIAGLNAVENMQIFLSKTFYPNADNDHFPRHTIDHELARIGVEDSLNGFTNRIFSDRFEENQKDTKRLHNLNHKNLFIQNSTRNFKQIIAEHRLRELQVIGCIIVEIFLARKLRPLASGIVQSFEERVAACKNVLKMDVDALPKCVQYPVKLLLAYGRENSNPVITDSGLPKPSAHQILQPFLSNFLFPFPLVYHKLYVLLRSLLQYDAAGKLLNIYTYFDCDGSNCGRFETLDKTRIAFSRRIAECKVNAFVVQLEGFLAPQGFDQFPAIDLLLPHIIDLLNDDETSILAAWYLFDPVATVLGPKATRKQLLEPILRLYDAENDERINFLNSNFDSSMKFTSGSAFKSSKTGKLYHHSFLLRLIVRFGLKCFLENFVSPLIEAIGGYKEPIGGMRYHYHDNKENPFRKSRSTKNLKMCDDDGLVTASPAAPIVTVIVPTSTKKVEKDEEVFAFDGEGEQRAAVTVNLTDSSDDTEAINKIIDQFEISITGGESMLDLRLNHSGAEEATEDTNLSESMFKEGNLSGLSFDDQQFAAQSSSSAIDANSFVSSGPMSPTIPIPTTSANRIKFDTIDCEIGSKKSNDGNEFMPSTSGISYKGDDDITIQTSAGSRLDYSDSRIQQQYKISEMSAESLLWLSHRLGPVLTARYLTRNLLKMLTLCYVGQENLLPDYGGNQIDENNDNLINFSIAEGRIVGDRNAIKVLECLTSITALFGDQFILLQYFPHITELIVLCKKRITSSLEGGLISSVQLLKYLVPCLSDSSIMDQLHDVLLKSIIHPIIRLLGSTRCLMPSGFLARSILARKLLDVIYVLAVRIGPEMTKEHLCVPALQRFFLIFDKAYGITDHLNESNDSIRHEHSPSPEDSHFVEIRRDGGIKEWSIKGSPIQILQAKPRNNGSPENITPPKQVAENIGPMSTTCGKALEEIRDVFTPNLAHVAYVPFLKYLGDHIMRQFVKNLLLILNLCHDYEQPDYASGNFDNRKLDLSLNGIVFDNDDSIHDTSLTSNTFGTPVIGNRIEVRKESVKSEIGPMELLDLVAHKYEQINTLRHLRGNWLAYWEHEIGRPEKNNHFNLKQIKLQTFAGHTNSVRSLLCLDNENSFISASKDKTVKLWSLRSEGDGSKISSCQFTYVNHRKSVHSLAFLESLRLAISCDSGVHIWDPFVGGDIGHLDSHKLTPVSIVKTYPAPSALVLAGTAESTVKIIDARLCSYVNEWKFATNTNGSVRCMAIAPSGNWIAIGLSSGQMILCDGRTGVIIASWRATDGELLQLIAVNEHQVVSSSLDHSICVWSTIDGSLLHYMKNPNEPSHCLLSHHNELIFGTPANRIGVFSSVSADATYSITKLRSETFKGVLTSLALLPLNRMLLVGGDSGNISLLC